MVIKWLGNWSRTPQIRRSLGGMRHQDRRCGAVMRYGESTRSTASQWRVARYHGGFVHVPILVNSIGSNPVNNEVLTVIDFGAASESGFSSTERLQEVESTTLTTKRATTCKAATLLTPCSLPVCLSAAEIVTKATPAVRFSIGKA
jgi:hypothetical protein